MIKNTITISEVKDIIKKMEEKPLVVTISLGRNKYEKFSGKINGVYPALFTILPFNSDFKGKTSYSYSEYLCGKVKLREFSVEAYSKQKSN